MKTKYTDTLIKLLLTLGGLSGCIRRLIARKSAKRIKKNNIIIMIIIIIMISNIVPKLSQ